MFDPKAYAKAYYEANKEKIIAKNNAWKAANPARKRQYDREYRTANKEKISENGRKYRIANKEKIRAAQKAWNETNGEYLWQYKKEWYAANKEKVAENHRRRWQCPKYRAKHCQKAAEYRKRNRFKIALCSSFKAAANGHYAACITSIEEIKAAFTGKCHACDRPETKTSKLHLDHDHKTGQFRGWLCRGCNVALGCCQDSPIILKQLADYLKPVNTDKDLSFNDLRP